MPTPIAKRYAQALFDFLRESGKLETAHKEIGWLKGFTESSPEFQDFLKDPVISPEDRRRVLADLFKKRLSAETYRFLPFLISKDRIEHLRDICEEFASLYLENQNIIRTRITTPVPLTDKQTEEICLRLKKRFNKNILPELTVDPEILGGIRIQVNDEIIDYSVRHRLASFEHSLAHS